jgi:hypothetical protein
MQQLTYPVLKYTPRFLRGRLRNERDLLVVGERNLQEGCFKDCVLIDSDANRYRVASARQIRWTWNPWNLFPVYRTVWVDLELSDPQKMDLDSVKREVLELLLKKRWYTRAHYGRTEIEELINTAPSVPELIDRLSVFP